MKSSEDSPKTPGGISKTLLTPCRRLGLSRKFNRKGPSPFISPLSSSPNSTEIATPIEPKKRKIFNNTSKKSTYTPPAHDQANHEPTVLDVPETVTTMPSPSHISVTPYRNVSLSRKNSKYLLAMKEEDMGDVTENMEICSNSTLNNNRNESKLVKTISKKKIKPHPQTENRAVLNDIPKDSTKSNEFNIENCPKKSPNNLNKECIVLIQNKMLKNIKSNIKDNQNSGSGMKNTVVSQSLFDSDSDDIPLCELNNKQDKKLMNDLHLEVEVEKGSISNSTPKTNTTVTSKLAKPKAEKKYLQNSFNNDDDDFVFDKKKTILVKKSYEKVVKPSKAKSTGSITQKDIDEIKSRIEMKKKLLIAKAMTEDTEELRNLMKKWQKGCQEALFELLDLMKKKFQDSRNMDYSEILKTLKIPPELVGYDTENDCFITPDDSSIILSSINT